MLDADQAGHDATCRGIDHAVRAQRCPDLTVVRLDPALANDPDGYLRDDRQADIEAAIDARRCAIGWRTQTLLPNERHRSGATRVAGEWLGSLGPRWSLEQDAAITVAATALNADVDATRRAFRARYWTATTPARSATR